MKLSLESIAATSAIVVSFAALFVAWDQSMVMRAQQHASVWPMIEVEYSLDRDDQEQYVSFEISNVGVGPALIRQASISVNGQPISDYDTFSSMALIDSVKGSGNIRASSFLGVLGAGRSRTPFRVAWQRSEQYDKAFAAVAMQYVGSGAPDIDVEMCYCSIFERCWKISQSNNAEQIAVANCPTDQPDPVTLLMNSLNNSKPKE